MAKLPPRRVLRSIVMDAISDRQGFSDPMIDRETASIINAHKALLLQLADDAPMLDDKSRDALALACFHARIWRESYVDSWVHTGEKDIILKARQDVERIDRTERALGFRYRQHADIALEGARSVSLNDLRSNLRDSNRAIANF